MYHTILPSIETHIGWYGILLIRPSSDALSAAQHGFGGDARRRTSHYHLPPFPPSIQYSMKKPQNKAIHASSYARQASVAGAIGVHYGRISHPGWRANQTLLPPNLCYAPLLAPIPIERKSSLVIPRLQHVRSFTRRCRRFFPAHAEPVNHRY